MYGAGQQGEGRPAGTALPERGVCSTSVCFLGIFAAALGFGCPLLCASSPLPPALTQVLEFKGGLAERAGEVAGPLGHVATALDQLRASPQLRLLLHTALRLGNALNAGRKAPQRGIRLASLKCVTVVGVVGAMLK